MPSLPFRWSLTSRPPSPLPAYNVADYDDDSDDQGDRDTATEDPTQQLLGFSLARRSSSQSHLLLPRSSFPGSNQTSAANSPFPSRPSSPLPFSQPVFAPPLYTSTSEDEPASPLLLTTYSRRRKWWPRRRKREGSIRQWRGWKRAIHRIVKHPLFPTQPLTILLTLLLLTTFALLLTVSLIYILNPDKYPLPWRQYCSHDSATAFPPPDFESLPPAGVFLGVFSMDAAVERRMLVRTTWASHVRSRGMDAATDRTVVRFILGKPRVEWERRVGLEMQTYNDMIILPMAENMNNGKTHAFFTWAYENALVPPPNTNHTFNPRRAPASSHARHSKRRVYGLGKFQEEGEKWVSPDFVIKADDDSFVMLAELEGRLRVEWYEAIRDGLKRHGRMIDPLIFWGYLVKSRFMAGELYALSWSLVQYIATSPRLLTMTRGAEDKQTSKWIRLHPQANEVRWRSEHCWMYDHPRAGTVYSHGFLFPSEVKRVAREVHEAKALLKNATAIRSSSVSPSVAALMTDPGLVALSTLSSGSSSTYGGDSTTTMADSDPSDPQSWDPDTWRLGPPSPASTPLPPSSPFLSRSTVSRFGNRYTFPVANLTIPMQVETLVEGSRLSLLRKGLPASTGNLTAIPPPVGEDPTWGDVERAWENRETYEERYALST
ncbi:hypothetical protein FRB99_001346, partial [Tulasnella sp. 403]